MPASKAQQKAVNKYMKANYDEIKVRIPKGQKELIQAHAQALGESVNGLIWRLLQEELSKSNAGVHKTAEETENL
jgi:predicted HicB family RNase H-like nuclease